MWFGSFSVYYYLSANIRKFLGSLKKKGFFAIILRIHFTGVSKISSLDGHLCTHCNSGMKTLVQFVKRKKKEAQPPQSWDVLSFIATYTFLILNIPSVEM